MGCGLWHLVERYVILGAGRRLLQRPGIDRGILKDHVAAYLF